jgi:hypothetical protein
MPVKYILAATLVAVTSALTVSSAHATNGRAAVDLCIDLPGCKLRFNKATGSIDIFPPDGGIIHCPSATDECHAYNKKKGSRAGQVRGGTDGTASQ